MRGSSTSGAAWRSVAVAMLAVFFVMAIQADPAHAATGWKDAIAEIAEIRDAAIDDLLDLVAEYQDYLAGEPSAEEAASELADIKADIEKVAARAGEDIRSVMDDYPRNSQVQDAGVFAIGLVGLARNYAIDQATLDFNEYIDRLPPPTTTTTVPVTTTTVPVTTTTVPVTTTTTVPVTTTTTVPVTTTTTIPVTTTTMPATTTTTLPGTTTTTPTVTTTTTTPSPTTTTTTSPGSTTSTTAGAAGGGDPGGEPPASTSDAGSSGSPDGSATGGGEDVLEGRGPVALGGPQVLEEPRLAPSFFSDSPGLADSLTRILEPVLPTAVAEVVVSPLLVFELLWRAVSSSGRGLVMPISLLVFSLISLLWDRRSKKFPIAT